MDKTTSEQEAPIVHKVNADEVSGSKSSRTRKRLKNRVSIYYRDRGQKLYI